MRKYLRAKDAAELLGSTERHVRRMCESGSLKGARKNAGQWQVPTTADVRLLAVDAIDQTEQPELDGVSPEKIKAAMRKIGVVRAAERYAGEYTRKGLGTWRDGFGLYALQEGKSRSTLYRWRRTFKESGLVGLVDTRGGGNTPERIRVSEEAFEYFKSQYLDPRQLTLRQCWSMVTYHNKHENMGWRVSMSPNQTTVLRAMKGALARYGPPDMAKIDNGKDYDSKMWQGETKNARRIRRALKSGYLDEDMVGGLYAMMGIDVSFSIKYHPQSKLVERFFDTMDCQFTKTLPTYCGKDAHRKPEDLNTYLKSEKAIAEAYDLAGFADLFGQYAEAYNNTVHSGRGMEGMSPAQAMATRTSRRVLGSGVLDLLARVWIGTLKVGKNGVKAGGIWYGQFDHKLMLYQGREVRVSCDPDDMRCVYVYDAETFKPITVAEQIRLIRYADPVADEDLREAMRQKTKARKLMRDYRGASRVANMDLTDLAIQARLDAAQAEPDDRQSEKMLRLVRTPLDGQGDWHEREKARRAVGAESTGGLFDLGLDDFEELPVRKRKRLNLFGDGDYD